MTGDQQAALQGRSDVRAAFAAIHRQGDRLLTWLLAGQMALALCLAGFYATWNVTFGIGGAALSMFLLCRWLVPGSPLTRSVAGIALQMFVALHIYQLHGMAEQHFFFFTALTAMIVYQDWVCMWPGTVLIIAQHIVFAVLHNSGEQLYFFEDAYVGVTKLSFHFGIALFQVVLCGAWAFLLRQRTLQSLQQQALLHEARERAEAATAARSEFLATVSHEIRTPMTGMLGMAGLMLDESLPAEVREYAETVYASGQALLTILDDVLDFAKLEAGRLPIVPAAFDLLATVEDVGELLAERAHGKDIDFVVDWDEQAPRQVVGDGGRIRQILLNLCSNAIKFTSIGHVLLRVRCTGPATAVPTFELRVEDTGIGIPAAARSRLFRKFEQGRGDTAQRHGGTGLGLAISRQLAELMHGSLEVQSTEGQGSTFTLALPLPRAAASGAALPPSLHGRRLLLVGGHAALRDAHARSCRAAGAECIAVADGAGATAAVKEHGFDTAVVQHGLPDCDLDQAITRLRLLAPKLRILVLSSAPRVELEHRLAELGASGLLGLPVRLPLLLDALVAVGNVEPGTFIGRGALALRGRRNRQPAPQLGLHVLLADDSPVTQNLVRLLLERAACTVEVVGNGRQALEAWSQQHFDLLLLDCRMPEMDGLTATREIRRREVAGARTPIFALTADALQTDRDRCQQAGMDRHISKPIDRNALYAALQSLPPRPLGTQPSLLPG